MTAASGLRVLDTDHLARQTFGDSGLERDLLVLFEAQCARLIPLILRPGPEAGRAEATHTLRGGALAVGAARLADVSDTLEAALLDSPGDEALQPLLAGLREAARDLEREIGDWRRRAGREARRPASADLPPADLPLADLPLADLPLADLPLAKPDRLP